MHETSRVTFYCLKRLSREKKKHKWNKVLRMGCMQIWKPTDPQSNAVFTFSFVTFEIFYKFQLNTSKTKGVLCITCRDFKSVRTNR